ncbi:hypothetical protein ACFQE1_12710 [Halobium palmae]|uniref:DUF8027 domain-containing protein n=1 Tax=Halobium palmae TaxID=1776492 RepID=A0ABD5S0L6_9EURY
MPVPGYDPDDVDDKLEELLAERDADEFLTEEERRRYESGERFGDLLDEEEIRRLLDRESDASA